MHPDLHTVSQTPQPEHSVSSIAIYKKRILKLNRVKVPTGQIVLQNNLPLLKDIIPIINKTAPKNRPSQLNALTSIGKLCKY